MNIGNQAEKIVANKLAANGYKVLDLNWRSKLAEIDIVAKKDGTIYFIEVKYRSTDSFGEGYEYVNSKKIHKMRLGSELWSKYNKYDGDRELMVASVSGPDFNNIELIGVLDQ